ncbi:hypothetical protein L873DRAFT_1820811 [Choiromyces venosus 120613-1]|uniref:Ubiquitin 3 binding protein But2 C-terminal domain-containing protein n=1 Tax=Choiromyces venosus 120613-1 TaxID=1336337 RepID=A0A3N4J9V9_9PEZI|nr:hypothetical protein L873DRAFT_1820811 [Choiromyces venosus 120613-1]
MKFTVIAAISILSTLASGLALPNLTPRDAPIYPNITIAIKEDFPTQSFLGVAEVSRTNGANNVKTLLGFSLDPFPAGKKCTISFSDAFMATGSRRMQFFTTIGYPADGDTWYNKPSTNNQLGTFLTSDSGAGPATVVEDFGLTFDCPTVPTSYGYEVQPVWDNDNVTWAARTSGFFITPA